LILLIMHKNERPTRQPQMRYKYHKISAAATAAPYLVDCYDDFHSHSRFTFDLIFFNDTLCLLPLKKRHKKRKMHRVVQKKRRIFYIHI